MNKFSKYLTEQEKNEYVEKDRQYKKLVANVSNKIDYSGEGAAEFIYDLLTDINFHSEAKDTYNFLMNKIQ